MNRVVCPRCNQINPPGGPDGLVKVGKRFCVECGGEFRVEIIVK